MVVKWANVFGCRWVNHWKLLSRTQCGNANGFRRISISQRKRTI